MMITKTTHKLFASVDFDEEESYLNSMSEKGWHFIANGGLKQKFTYDKDIRYIYRLDYNRNVEDPSRYKSIFEEQGWEHVISTVSDWHYFRKPYDETLDEAEYAIYSDSTSKQEIYSRLQRWFKLLGAFFAFMLLSNIIHLSNHPDLSNVGYTLCYALCTSALAMTYIRMRKKLAGVKTKGRLRTGSLLCLVVICAVIGLFGQFFDLTIGEKPSSEQSYLKSDTTYIKPDEADYTTTFEILDSDQYDFTLDADSEVLLSVSITNEDGNEVFYQKGDQLKVDDVHLSLDEGVYNLHIHYAEEGLTEACKVHFAIKSH